MTKTEEADEADRSAVELAGVEAAQTAESSAVEETEVAAAAAAPKPEVEALDYDAEEPDLKDLAESPSQARAGCVHSLHLARSGVPVHFTAYCA